MSNNNIPPGAREFFVSDSPGANDNNNGGSPNFPLLTLAEAHTRVTNLVPPLDPALPATLLDIGDSVYNENLVLIDSEFVNMPNVRLISLGGTAITAGGSQRIVFSSVQTSANSGDIAFDSGGNSRIGFDPPSVVLNGPDQTGILISGASTQVFCNISQILAIGTNTVLYDYQSSGEPTTLNANQLLAFNTNSIGIRVNSTGTSPVVVDLASIDMNVTGNVGLTCIQGSVVADIIEINAPTAINVDDTAAARVFSAAVNGDIIVNQGGRLDCDILSHDTGNVINAGAICGRIGDVWYDCGQDGTTIVVIGQRRGIIPFAPANIGRLTIDTTTDTFVSAVGSYEQTSGLSRSVTFTIEDADTPATKYFEGTLSDTGQGVKFVDLVANDPLPINSVVNLNFTVNRDQLAAGVRNPNLEFEFERV